SKILSQTKLRGIHTLYVKLQFMAQRNSSKFTVFISSVLLIALLYFAQDVIIPLALAILLSFVLSPAVHKLQRWRIPKVVATFTVTIFACAVMGVIEWAIAHQVLNLAEDLPQYKQNLS